MPGNFFPFFSWIKLCRFVNLTGTWCGVFLYLPKLLCDVSLICLGSNVPTQYGKFLKAKEFYRNISPFSCCCCCYLLYCQSSAYVSKTHNVGNILPVISLLLFLLKWRIWLLQPVWMSDRPWIMNLLGWTIVDWWAATKNKKPCDLIFFYRIFFLNKFQ